MKLLLVLRVDYMYATQASHCIMIIRKINYITFACISLSLTAIALSFLGWKSSVSLNLLLTKNWKNAKGLDSKAIRD